MYFPFVTTSMYYYRFLDSITNLLEGCLYGLVVTFPVVVDDGNFLFG